MLGIILRAGIRVVQNPAAADVVIINTCAFIHAAKQEAVETVLEAGRLKEKNPNLKVLVAGCLPRRYPQLPTLLREADGFIGPGDINRIVTVIRAVVSGKRPVLTKTPSFLSRTDTPRFKLTPRHYAYLKIADGCDNRCHYCVIPAIRGPYHSRSVVSLTNEASRLVKEGVKEICLISQDSTYYGHDRGGRFQLPALCRRLAKIRGLEWIRILYSHPAHFTDELIRLIAEEPKICRYLDVPIQHISDRVLKAMGRNGSDEVKNLLLKLRTIIPGVALRTSLIVGYPGETERDFRKLYDFVREWRFERLGVFMYSQEEKTRAAKLKPQVSEEKKAERFDRIMTLQRSIAGEINRVNLGKTLRVLIDEISEEGVGIGRTEFDAPEVDNLTYVRGDKLKKGRFMSVKITDALEYDLYGEAE